MNRLLSTSRSRRSLLAGVALVAVFATPVLASAQEDRVVVRVHHRLYPVEFEPHMTFGWDNIYGAAGVGAGLRVSIPILRDGFVTRYNDNLAISFGGDFLHYENCYYSTRCGANYLMVPLVAQWNFFVAPRWSIGPEAGAFFYKGFFDGCNAGPGPVGAGCTTPSQIGARPSVSFNARLALGEHVALAMRVGYPTINLGLSFL